MPSPPSSTGARQRRQGDAFSCASRTSTSPAHGRNSRRRSSRISPGSGFAGKSPCCGKASGSTPIATRSLSSKGWGSSIRLSSPARRSPPWRRRPDRHWPRDPDGAPLYPGEERNWPPSRRQAEMARGRPYALRLDMARALAAARRCPGGNAIPSAASTRNARRRSRRLGRCRAGPQGDAGELSPRRRRGRCLAGRHRRGARQGSRIRDLRPPAAAGRCWPARAAPTSTTGSSSTRPAGSWRNHAVRRRCAPAAPPAKAPTN